METKIWTKAKSVTLSLICTRVLIGVVIALAVVLPLLITNGFYGRFAQIGFLSSVMDSGQIFALLFCVYAAFVPAMIALIMLDRMLGNIRKELIFVRVNVRYLRAISWCCFIIAIIMLIGWPFISFLLIFIAAAAAFFGLLMRVVKNVIDAACELKDENDFTI